jgi:hypothetical protein
MSEIDLTERRVPRTACADSVATWAVLRSCSALCSVGGIDSGSVADRRTRQRLDQAPAAVLEIAVDERNDGHIGRR